MLTLLFVLLASAALLTIQPEDSPLTRVMAALFALACLPILLLHGLYKLVRHLLLRLRTQRSLPPCSDTLV